MHGVLYRAACEKDGAALTSRRGPQSRRTGHVDGSIVWLLDRRHRKEVGLFFPNLSKSRTLPYDVDRKVTDRHIDAGISPWVGAVLLSSGLSVHISRVCEM